jgi:putative Holliday junction resolvase
MNASAASSSARIPPTGRLLGIDFGTKRVGIALATPDHTIASPLEIYQRRNPELDARYFRTVVADYSVQGIIVGLPVHVNGEEGASARAARQYGQWLSELTGLPVDFWDERFTSCVADDYLLAADMTRQQRKRRLDMVAAQIILQSYLDRARLPLSTDQIPEPPLPDSES